MIDHQLRRRRIRVQLEPNDPMSEPKPRSSLIILHPPPGKPELRCEYSGADRRKCDSGLKPLSMLYHCHQSVVGMACRPTSSLSVLLSSVLDNSQIPFAHSSARTTHPDPVQARWVTGTPPSTAAIAIHNTCTMFSRSRSTRHIPNF